MSVGTIDNPFLTPPGSYPPATVRWLYNSTNVPVGFGEWVVPWQPGTPLGLLVPIVWQLTDVFFRVENAASVGNTTLSVARYTGTGAFATTNFLNDTPIVIPAGQNECIGRPFTLATINNPKVNSGDKLQLGISLGTGASGVVCALTFTQSPGV